MLVRTTGLRVPAILWRLAGLFAIAALGSCIYWCVRLAYADYLFHRGSSEDIARAIGLVPSNPGYYARRAHLEPGQRLASLEKALALNPRDSAAWIELGLLAEGRNDLPEAERCLLESARVDRTFNPRWTLANYYFRRTSATRPGQASQDRNVEEFWRWAREAVNIASDDLTPLFRLCWKMSRNADEICRRVLPDRPQALARFLSFLLAENHLEDGESVAQRLMAYPGPERVSGLLGYCDRLLETGRLSPALRLWNGLVSRNLVQSSLLDPEKGIVLTNGQFVAMPLQHGFDWRMPFVPGAAVAWMEAPGGLKISFSGRQPEQCALLIQRLPLLPGAYRAEYEYRTSGIGDQSGVRWEMAGAQSAYLAGEGWKKETFRFCGPSSPALARLALAYRRPPGTVRIQGWLWLRAVRLAPAASSGCDAPDRSR